MRTKKIIVSTTILSMIAVMLVTMTVHAAPVAADQLMTSNELVIRGSSTVYPVSILAQGAFQTAHPGKTVTIPEAQGSGAGLDALSTPTCDMAATSKIPDSSTTGGRNYWNTATGGSYAIADLRIWAIGKDSVGIVVSKNMPSNLYNAIQKVCNAKMISDLYSKDRTSNLPIYQTWNSFLTAIGSSVRLNPDQNIDVIGRVINSGTYDGFKTFFLSQVKPNGGSARGDNDLATQVSGTSYQGYQALPENQDVVDTVYGDSYAIGFVGLGFLEDNPSKLQGIWIGTSSPASNFIEPTKENAYAGVYKYDGDSTTTPTPIYRWLWYATNGVPNKDSQGAIKSNFISAVKANPSYINNAGYLRMYRSDFTSSTATPFAGQDTAPLHPGLPDDKVDSNDVAYFVDGYIAYWGSSHLVNPYCDFNGDNKVDSTDVAAFVDGYIQYWSHSGP